MTLAHPRGNVPARPREVFYVGSTLHQERIVEAVAKARAEWEAEQAPDVERDEALHSARRWQEIAEEMRDALARLKAERGVGDPVVTLQEYAAVKSELRDAHTTAERRQGTIDKLEAEVERLKEELKSAQQEDVVQVGSRLWRAELELGNVRAERDSLRIDKLNAETERYAATAKIAAAEEQVFANNRTWQARVDAISQEADNIRSIVASHKADTERERSRADSAEAQRDEAREGYATLERQRDASNALATRLTAERDGAEAYARQLEVELVQAVQSGREEGGRETLEAVIAEVVARLRAQMAETKTQASRATTSSDEAAPAKTPNAGPVGHESPALSVCFAHQAAARGEFSIEGCMCPKPATCPHCKRRVDEEGHNVFGPDFGKLHRCDARTCDHGGGEGKCPYCGEDVPSSVEPKPERVGEWCTRRFAAPLPFWAFKCCGRTFVQDEVHKLATCTECGAVWTRPEVGK